jgi:hypothetical protein
MTIPHPKLIIFFVAALSAFSYFAFRSQSKPRILSVDEVPIAFWAWGTNAPDPEHMRRVFAATKARTLFLRSGQFDSVNGKVQRIRGVSGKLPASVDLHLAYNGTQRFLTDFEKLGAAPIARSIADVCRADMLRSQRDGANVLGVQLDFDVPTRLLPLYADMLRQLRALVPGDTKLSITGLPTWMTAGEIAPVLDAVDFWIPQFYGGNIPTHISERIPISSAPEVERSVIQARSLGKPFYAGISAYGYAIHYDTNGDLIELRGNIEHAVAAAHPDLELIERTYFSGGGEQRYEYRASRDLVLFGLNLRSGESLVFDIPTSASVRAEARAVRENAGERLLGICVFRLPSSHDASNLTAPEIAEALLDRAAHVTPSLSLNKNSGGTFVLRVTNDGTAGTIVEDGAVTIDLAVPAGSIGTVRGVDRFSDYQTLCGDAEPCSPQRATILRLCSTSLEPGSSVSWTLTFDSDMPETFRTVVTANLDDGRVDRQESLLRVSEE